MPVDRCVFRLSTLVGGVMCTCIILVYVDDLFVVGDDSLVGSVRSAIKKRLPVTVTEGVAKHDKYARLDSKRHQSDPEPAQAAPLGP